MASADEETSGRRTRSGRKVSGSQPTPTPSPIRATRRTSKRQAQEQLTEHEAPEIVPEEEPESFVDKEFTGDKGSQQSDIIQEMLAEAAQGMIADDGGEVDDVVYEEHDDIIETVEEIIEEVPQGEDFIVYEEQVVIEDEHQQQPQHEEDVEMYTVTEEEHIHTEVPVNSETGIDEKSSSFPFGTVGQSETSDDAQNEEEEEEAGVNMVETGAVESSLLASLAGDNANSLPSVGGGEETECKRSEDFEVKVDHVDTEPIQPNCEKMDSDDSLSEPAIAEDLVGAADASSATIVNTEMVSEDELPLPTKPEINDAEEVSDDELPAPQRAELPADAEVISEDELPAAAAAEKKSPLTSPKKADTSVTVPTTESTNRQTKRKAEEMHRSKEPSPEKQKQTDVERKKSDEQYNPMSPTSESNDSPPTEKKLKVEEANDPEHKEKKRDKEREKDKEKEREREKEKDKERDRDREKEKEKEKEKERKKLPDLEKYWRAVKDDPADFTGWTYLLQYVDNESDAEAAREAYDAFLAHYPYCYGYWRKYADYEKRKGIKANCNAVFERGLEAIPLSVDLWIHYLAHVKSNHGDEQEYIRSEFERAIAACGLEFRSDKLWDAYIKWESDGKRYQHVLHIYDRLLVIPTQGYSAHFDNFQDLINQHSITSTVSADELNKLRAELRESSSSSRSRSSKSRRGSSKEKDRENHSSSKDERKEERSSSSKEERSSRDERSSSKEERSSSNKEERSSNKEERSSRSETNHERRSKSPNTHKEAEGADCVIVQETPDTEREGDKPSVDITDPSTLTEEEISALKDRIISLRRKLHKATVAAVTARWTYEEGIKRPYFHVKPLERCQLKNWKDYLDFEIEKGDRKRILVLFERCLIACALYDEFWLKMIRYLETQLDQPDMPAVTSDVFRRACQIHHPDKPSLHLMWAAFEECQSNFDAAADVLLKLEKKCPNLLQVAYRRINVERRRGDLVKCRELYEHYIANAKNKTIAGSLTIKYARFLNKICNDLDGGLRVLRQTLEKDTANTRVALQMIDLALQRAQVDEDEVVLIMDKFMARENIDPEQKVLFAQRKVEFLEDFGSTAKGLQDAQRALQLALNKANEAKKKRESSPSRKAAAGLKDNAALASSTMQAAYNNGAAATSANYNYGSANSAYYGQQNSGAYQQQQQQGYDNYYNHWQYGSGYSGYGQWSGYGNYY